MRRLHRFLPRLALAGALFGFTWFLHTWLIAPFISREAEFLSKKAELQGNLDGARKKLVEIKDAEQKTGYARGDLNRLLGGNAAGSVMFSFPADTRQYFTGFGLHSATVRYATAQEEPKLPGYRKLYWSVGLPVPKSDRNVEGLLLATAELEQQERYVKVIDFALEPDPMDPSMRNGSVGIVILDRK